MIMARVGCHGILRLERIFFFLLLMEFVLFDNLTMANEFKEQSQTLIIFYVLVEKVLQLHLYYK